MKSLSKLMDTYYKSVGRNSTLLLNFPVAPNGRIHPIDSLRGLAFNKMVQEVFKGNLADKARIRHKGLVTTISFRKPTAFNRFLAEEDIALGQRVRDFTLEAYVDDAWLPLADVLAEHALVNGGDGLTTIGHRRIACFPTVTATKLRFTVTDTKAEPIIKKIGVYLAPELTPDIPDSGEKKSASLPVSFIGNNQLVINFGDEKTVKGFRYLPPPHGDGIVTHYTLWANNGTGAWTQIASGEFSNIVNNPIWQTVSFPPTNLRTLMFQAERLSGGMDLRYADVDVVMEEGS